MCDDTRFFEWWSNRPDDEIKLQHTAFEYEAYYFRDVRLELKDIQKRLLDYDRRGENGEWIENTSSALGDEPITIDGWIFRYHCFDDDTLGLCRPNEKTILIRRDLRGTTFKAVLLHEMLHAYERELPGHYREWLAIWLYQRLLRTYSKRKLHRFLDSIHILLHQEQHNVMFLLKSLKLDRHCRFQPGTVFAYGRAELFA